jgi:hypothetical protein
MVVIRSVLEFDRVFNCTWRMIITNYFRVLLPTSVIPAKAGIHTAYIFVTARVMDSRAVTKLSGNDNILMF